MSKQETNTDNSVELLLTAQVNEQNAENIGFRLYGALAMNGCEDLNSLAILLCKIVNHLPDKILHDRLNFLKNIYACFNGYEPTQSVDFKSSIAELWNLRQKLKLIELRDIYGQKTDTINQLSILLPPNLRSAFLQNSSAMFDKEVEVYLSIQEQKALEARMAEEAMLHRGIPPNLKLDGYDALVALSEHDWNFERKIKENKDLLIWFVDFLKNFNIIVKSLEPKKQLEIDLLYIISCIFY